MLFGPALSLGMQNPFLLGAIKANAHAQEGFGSIASEWQGFMGHRLQEDIALMHRLAQSSTPDQIFGVCTDFWHKAAEDYGKEITTMTKLMTEVSSKMVEAARNEAHERQKAA